MARYVDGFVIPVPRRNLATYRRQAARAGKIWRELGALVADAVEEALPTSKQDRHHVELHLVDEPCREILLGRVRATAQMHVLTPGRSPRLIERVLDTGGDERECGTTLELQRLP